MLQDESAKKKLKTKAGAPDRAVQVLTGHTGNVSAVCFSTENKGQCFSGSADHSIRCWDVEAARCALTLVSHSVLGCTLPLLSLPLRIVPLPLLQRSLTLYFCFIFCPFVQHGNKAINALSLSPSSPLMLVSAHPDHVLRLWDPRSKGVRFAGAEGLGFDALLFLVA